MGARLILQPGEILSLAPTRAPVTVSCSAGCLHITQSGDPQDHILNAGDSFQSSERGKVVVSCYKSPAVATVEARGQLTTGHVLLSPVVASAITESF
ncbi:MAG TPA: DUF2917 domain-containing protein [Spirochaetia bacterium]|nr:DUF2917 domain-containing protein [Spirochaetia bacterium]